MLRKVFHRKNDFTKKRKIQASTSFHARTSTPNVSAVPLAACATSMPNVSFIERSTSAPILVSDASIADLRPHFRICPQSKNSSLRTSTGSSISRKDSPRSCLTRDTCKRGVKKLSLGRCVQIQTKEIADKPGRVEQLYFNDEAKSGGSSPRGHCINSKIFDSPKVKPSCSAGVMTTIHKLTGNRPCGKVLKDSGATCSLADSSSGTSDANARAAYYQNKLLATQQILQNKEEMIGVQADSLAVAEARIATLNERANELKRELDRKTKEYHTLRKSMDCCKVEKNDVSVITERPMEDQRDIVHTLENNLSVIEDLYRECFYETAKQENLIEMLRSSYLDVRLMDKQKADHIGRLQNVINTQKWSLDRCQDIAMEVDGLKMEISNFLNNSSSTNNDSGMWERSEDSLTSPAVHEDLHDVREQLLRLQEILAIGCTCGLNEENMKIKEENETLKIKLGDLKERLCEVECSLASRKTNDMKYKAEIEAKTRELSQIREELIRSQEGSRDQSSTCDAMATQLRHTQALLEDKTTELSQLQQANESQANKIKDLQTELEKADQIIKENCKMRSEVSYLSAQVSLWRAQLEESQRRARALEAELGAVRDNCAHIDACYRQKAGAVAELQAHLEEAHARSTALCGEARHAVCAVRHWMRHMRDKHREQENIIKEKDSLLKALQRRLEDRQSDTQRTSGSENTASCSKCLSSRDEHSCCSNSKAGVRRDQCREQSASEMPSCSSTAAPIRLLRKKLCANKRCTSWMCDESVQEPTRRDAGSDATGSPAAAYCRNHDVRMLRINRDRPRDVSPTEELLARVGQLAEALEDGHRRWTRPRDPR